MNPYLSLLLGVVCAGLGGEFFVRGSVGLARQLGVSAGIIGATLAAFATSAPELSVGVQSALAGEPQISLGNAVGANVLNIALILGVAALIAPIRAPREGIKRDFPVALVVPVVTGALCLDGVISRVDGALLIGVFLVWFVFTVREAKGQRSATGAVLGARGLAREIVQGLAGLGLLALAGNRIVAGASTLATAWGLGEFIVGATVVAAGTTVPEMATVLIAKYRGHDEVGLGTVLGSNIFNGLFIVGTVACLHPILINWKEIDAALLFGVLSVVCVWPSAAGVLDRRRGLVLLVIYAVYLGVVLQRPPA